LFEGSATQRNTVREILSEVSSIATIFIFFDKLRVCLVHRDEPLRCRAKNDRVLATPAVRVPVLIFFTEQHYTFVAHELEDFIVCIKHALTSEVLDIGREAPRVV